MSDLHDVLTAVQNGFDGINARLDALNGRTRAIEQATAQHRVRLDHLEGRAASMRTWLAPIIGAISGGAAGAILTFLLMHVR